MNKFSQYNEESFLLEYFNDRIGLVVEIGAADGITNSNSRRLIENGWKALLVEPNPHNHDKIVNLYKNNEKITIENCGCAETNSISTFYIDNNDIYQQISTFSEDQMKKCKKIYSCDFEEVQMKIIKTSDLFNKHKIYKIDFLSIDTESYDESVIRGIDFDLFDIELICVEDPNTEEILNSQGYKVVHRTYGNTFFQKNK